MLSTELGQSCLNNYDCFASSVCCSRGACHDSSICLMGLKPLNDSCDFNYECQSRCCSVDSICEPKCASPEFITLLENNNQKEMEKNNKQEMQKKEPEKKKKPPERWGLVFLISFLVFILS